MGPCVRLLSCLHNDITRHMMGSGADEDDDSESEDGLGHGHHHHDHEHQVGDQAAQESSPAASDDVPALVQAGDADSEEEGSYDSEEADEEGGDLVFEPQHVAALQALLGGAVRVGDVPMAVTAPGEEGEAAMELTAALWNEQLLARV